MSQEPRGRCGGRRAARRRGFKGGGSWAQRRRVSYFVHAAVGHPGVPAHAVGARAVDQLVRLRTRPRASARLADVDVEPRGGEGGEERVLDGRDEHGLEMRGAHLAPREGAGEGERGGGRRVRSEESTGERDHSITQARAPALPGGAPGCERAAASSAAWRRRYRAPALRRRRCRLSS